VAAKTKKIGQCFHTRKETEMSNKNVCNTNNLSNIKVLS
jgi:hypothetical protein